jgi:hypothetical protein
MSVWRDPRLGIYKSALQKAIRRGQVDTATSAAHALLTVHGGRTALTRRLPAITAEDVGARWLPSVVRASRQAAHEPGAPNGRLLSVTAALASLPKSREAYWLAATCWGGRRKAPVVSRDALRVALAAGDYQAAVAIYIAARERRVWRSGPRVIDALYEFLRDAPAPARDIAEAALWREALGGAGVDELGAAAVIAAIDGPSGPLPDLPHIPYAAPDPAHPVAWEAFDSHTAIGRRVLGRVARRHGLPARMLAGLMFNYESILVGPSEEPARWRDEALELDARGGGWHSHDEGCRLWRSLRDEIRREIEIEAAR